MRTDENLMDLFDVWVEQGWATPLDRAFVRFLQAQQPESPEPLLLAAGLASYQLGRGHICLDLKAVLDDPDGVLSWPPEGDAPTAGLRPPKILLAGLTVKKWAESMQASDLVSTGEGTTPLVFSNGRLYLRRYWQYETEVAQGILKRLRMPPAAPTDLARRIDQLFGPLRNAEEQAKSDVHWQSVAAAIAAQSAFSVISGGPGTGKTTTVVQLLALLQDIALAQGNPLRISLAAPTGKAAARLTESIGAAVAKLPEALRDSIPAEVTTLHRLLGSRSHTRHFVHNAQNPLHVDLLVVDEASMIDLEMMAALLRALPETARLILIGDKDQLASVEAGSVLGDLCRNAERAAYQQPTIQWIADNTGYDLNPYAGSGTPLDQHIAILRKSYRFDQNSGIGALARAVNAGDSGRVAAVWQQDFDDIDRLAVTSTDEHGFARLVLDGVPSDSHGGYRGYLQYVQSGPQSHASEDAWLQAILDAFGRFQLLSPLRKGPWGVEGLNQKVAQIFFNADLINRQDGWYAGRPVMITRNNYTLGLMNGDIGIVLPFAERNASDHVTLRVVFPMADGSFKKVLPSRLSDVETVYAMTVHKSQGSEFDHAAMVLPESMTPVLTRELIYTAVTRARRYFTLVGPASDLLSEAVQQRTYRASGLSDFFQ
ncbi:exodeoxyribonuclease V subunit alpha [Desulfosarcina ovata]|uniref:RecBCD enzyme subunit RecD n=1 Tax=Desulfosarcina ovata subsp. ovata TaxID=2752305 RepID=A0A5K8A411_9BACT|nr:exodeoxyribonuclease V subunit alpha [Desulfosarcina ovata]BBO87166.1 RecBCD enzyme subunit RecD [Desulfosarcina ovata subsp. ovata]